MISARDIATRREQAPWASDAMVEQDYLLSQAVGAIFEDNFLTSQVAMRGGTVLHKAHLAPASRYSEDIDLVLVGERPPAHIKRALTRALRPLFGAPRESVMTTVSLAVRNHLSKSTIIRNNYDYDPTSTDDAIGQLKVEANVNETKSCFPLETVKFLVPVDGSEPRVISVLSYSLDEMMGTKLRALLQRQQSRDLFDLWWALSAQGGAGKLNPARVGAAFRFYMAQEGTKFTAAEVVAEIERRLTSRKFLTDMGGFLRTGVHFEPRQAANEFIAAYVPHIDG